MTSGEELPTDAEEVLDTVTGSIYGYQQPEDIQPHFLSKRTLGLVASNDASIAWLEVNHTNRIRFNGEEDDDEDDEEEEYDDADWIRHYEAVIKLGHDIGNNTQLKRVEIWDGMSHHHLLTFITSLSRNRSIEYLSIHGYDATRWEIIFRLLQTFIEQNCNFRAIELSSCSNLPIALLTSHLFKSQMSKLKLIDLNDNSIGDENVAFLIYALIAMPGLHNLLDLMLNKNNIGKKGCTALAVLLRKSTSRIYHVAIGENDVDDECLDILIGALVENNSLKTLDMGKQGFLTPKGWQCLSTFVSNRKCSLETIMLAANNMTDECFVALGCALIKNKTLKRFHLDEDSGIIPTGWQGCSFLTPNGWEGFSSCLPHPGCALEELILIYSSMNDSSATVLFQALANNTSLKKLTLSILVDELITTDGWVTCFELLKDSKCKLEELDFSQTNIDERGVITLTDLLSNHLHTVRSLNCSEIDEFVSENGWMSFVRLLLPDSPLKLEKLIIGNEDDTAITEPVVLSLVSALKNNTCLKLLGIGNAGVSSKCFDLLLEVLYDDSSMERVLRSNHTLDEFVCMCDLDFPPGIDSHLDLNFDDNKSRVVRNKMRLYLCECDIQTIGQVFGTASTSVMPHIIEWIGSDEVGFQPLYYLCKNFPWLFDVQSLGTNNNLLDLESNVGTTSPPHKLRKLT